MASKFLIPAILSLAGVGALAGVGLDIMGNTLSQAYPDTPHWIWLSLFWFSVALVVPLLLWLLWHWAQFLRHIFSTSRLVNTKSEEPEFMSAYEALYYIADQSVWGNGVRNATSVLNGGWFGEEILMKRHPILEAFPEFSRGASESRVDVLGRMGGDGSHVHIPYTDWLTIGIDNTTLVRRQISQTTRITPTGLVPFYTDLQIRRADVYRVWPRQNRG